MEEQTSEPKQRWMNTKRGKGFIAGFVMPLACNISNALWTPIEDNTRFYMMGTLVTFILIFVFVQFVLKRFGFEGFDLIERGTIGKDSNFVSFFAGVTFSLIFVGIALIIGSLIMVLFERV